MHTYPSGIEYEFDTFDSRIINIDDIAWSLSMQCRFNGHVSKFYSIAEHSILMAYYFVNKNLFMYALMALLHDAGETYTGDIISPIKRDFNSKKLENFDKFIFEFLFSQEEPDIIKNVDGRILITEAQQLTNIPRKDLYVAEGVDPMELEPLPVQIKNYTQEHANNKFLSCYYYLINVLRRREEDEFLSFALS